MDEKDFVMRFASCTRDTSLIVQSFKYYCFDYRKSLDRFP
ncbi:hypothetical protein PF008_g10418 [Phytophthora fragariae]|uniref:Uncharacterized protein n=1 Tax=Phytophthora fragariae TaxID=53985 RepID=A0A6G0RVE4_9STRA|nr:hypothetical protein PF003_g348 [Phytophthora fragariae]KAE9341900.1 hypothetical protein PF008_g10418 [Phytophthora fragariae]